MDWDEPTRALIKDVAEETATFTVNRTLTGLGVDTKNPMEVQKDMQHLRNHREGWAQSKSRGWLVVIGAATVGFVTMMWNGFIHMIRGGGGGTQ